MIVSLSLYIRESFFNLILLNFLSHLLHFYSFLSNSFYSINALTLDKFRSAICMIDLQPY